jgi:hypothetical protein
MSFVHPYRLLKKTTDAQTLNGMPRGMTPAIINYFKSHGIRVMLSIGGITYVSAWNQALAENATQLGLNRAEVAQTLGVGIEIDYEESRRAGHNPGLLGYMFWAAERPSTRGIGTVPPNTCENGVGTGATALNVPIPMPALRQR